MTIDHPVRRFLARVCSAGTMARVVDPTLADVRFERGRPAWIGYAALSRALAVHAIVSSPARARRLWNEDERAMPKAALACAAAAVIGTLVLIAPVMMGNASPQRIGTVRNIVLLSPQAMVIALPASMLLGIPMAFRRSRDRRRVLMRTLGISSACIAGALTMLMLVPDANQAYRVEASGMTDIPRGPAEWGLRELRKEFESLERTPAGAQAARELRYVYQVRLSLVGMALPLGLLAAAIAALKRGRTWTMAIGSMASIGYIAALFSFSDAASTVLARAPAVPPAAVAWLPVAALMAVALAAWHLAGARAARAAA